MKKSIGYIIGILATVFLGVKDAYAGCINGVNHYIINDIAVPRGIQINLIGAIEAILSRDHLYMAGDNLTVRDAMEMLANKSFEIRRHLFHRNGTPRQTARVLLNGTVLAHLDSSINSTDNVLIIAAQPCDG